MNHLIPPVLRSFHCRSIGLGIQMQSLVKERYFVQGITAAADSPNSPADAPSNRTSMQGQVVTHYDTKRLVQAFGEENAKRTT